MTRGDRLLIVALAVVCLLAWPIVAAARTSGESVEISGPAGMTVVSLSEDRTLHVSGRSGELTVVVEGGAVRVDEAECPDHVCVKTGAVSASGSLVACVPNEVVIRVGGGDADGLDARIR